MWQAAERENFVPDVQKMRRRVVDNIPAAQVDRELKLGPGGLRDVEFAVQLLQLVHGRTDTTLRGGTTLDALSALADGGYVGPGGRRRSSTPPTASCAPWSTASSSTGCAAPTSCPRTRPTCAGSAARSGLRTDPSPSSTGRGGGTPPSSGGCTRSSSTGRCWTPSPSSTPGEARLSPGAARQRLEALGYADPAAALRHLEALASGVSRKAAIQRTLLPVLLGWFADSADPDAGLLGFRKVSDALGKTPWYLRLLRDEGAAAENLARVLSAGRLAPDLLLRAPEAVALLGDPDGLRPARPRRPGAGGAGRGRPRRRRRGGGRRRRAGCAAGSCSVPPPATSSARTAPRTPPPKDPARSSTGSAPRSPTSTRPPSPGRCAPPYAAGGATTLPTRFAVIGMGRFGGHELGYGSDADVLFVHEPREGVDEQEAARPPHAVADEMRRLLQLPTADPPLLIDADLRPEGKSGPAGAHPGLLRRLLPALVAGLGEPGAAARRAGRRATRSWAARFIELIDPLRYPADGLGDDAVREIRRLKARMESERLPRGADPTTAHQAGPGRPVATSSGRSS